MDKITHEARLQSWSQIVRDCCESHLNKSEWCRQNGISLKSFYYWQRRVRQSASSQAPDLPAAVSPGFIRINDPIQDSGDLSSDFEGIPFLPAAVLKTGSLTIALSGSADRQFLSNLIGVLKDA